MFDGLTSRDRRRQRRRQAAVTLRQFLVDHQGYVPASWVHHLTGVSKSAISKAQGEGRVRATRFVFPDGHAITLVFLFDALRIDVYRRAPGWTEDLDDDAPPSHRRKAPRPPGPPRG